MSVVFFVGLFVFILFICFCFLFFCCFFCVKKKIHQTSNFNYIAGKREWSGGFFSSLQWTINDYFEPKLFLSRSCCKFHLIFKQHDIPYTSHPFQYRTESELCAWFVSLFTICIPDPPFRRSSSPQQRNYETSLHFIP